MRAIVCSAWDEVYSRSVLEFALGAKVDHSIFTDSSSARQLVMKRGVGQVRRLDGKLLWIQSRKDVKMVQVPADSNMADIITKPLGGQRTKYSMNLIGYWHSVSEEQTSRRAWEKGVWREKDLCREGQQDCQDDCENGRLEGFAANGYRTWKREKTPSVDWKSSFQVRSVRSRS